MLPQSIRGAPFVFGALTEPERSVTQRFRCEEPDGNRVSPVASECNSVKSPGIRIPKRVSDELRKPGKPSVALDPW